ncbi:MAG: NAD(P)H-binding protein [Emcibacter sp.]|nr:NAD(P)H-binding protein [Emcibacter sp.]
MTNSQKIFLVLGGTGRTGRHFVNKVLQEGHRVRLLVQNTKKVEYNNTNLNMELVQGSIIDFENFDELVQDVDYIASMLGNAQLQKNENINANFVKKLMPAMRKHGVKRFLYQAGGLTRPYNQNLPFLMWIVKNTLARYYGLLGQHRDNETVLKYLVEKAQDIEWIVHRAALISDAPSKGTLIRSKTKTSMATFVDCAHYNYRLLSDDTAIHTYDLSYYFK